MEEVFIPRVSAAPADLNSGEVEECIAAFKLGFDEYLWKWRGRRADERAAVALLSSHPEFFRKKPLGRKTMLSFVLDKCSAEEIGKLTMALVNSHDFASRNRLHTSPVSHVFFKGKTSDLFKVARLHNDTVSMATERLKKDCLPKHLAVSPVHDDKTLMSELHDSLRKIEQRERTRISSIRPLIPLSSMGYSRGFVAAALSAKLALSNYASYSEITGIDCCPSVTVGPLVVSGGLESVDAKDFAARYPASTYCFTASWKEAGMKHMKDTLDVLKATKPCPAVIFKKEESAEIREMAAIFQKSYVESAKKVFSQALPHKNSFYALYSLGLPPEFIGLGPALVGVIRAGHGKTLARVCPDLRVDIKAAGRLLNRENAKLLSGHPVFHSYLKSVSLLDDFVGEPLGPVQHSDFIHRNHGSNVFHLWKSGKDASSEMAECAKHRHNLL